MTTAEINQAIKEWERLNDLGLCGCKGAIMLRLVHMDTIARKIGYPLSMPVYLKEQEPQS